MPIGSEMVNDWLWVKTELVTGDQVQGGVNVGVLQSVKFVAKAGQESMTLLAVRVRVSVGA